MTVNLDCVGKEKIEVARREFTLVAEAEPADPEHNAITPVDVYRVIGYFIAVDFGPI